MITRRLHATDITNYFKCRRQFFFSQVERIKPRDQVRPAYFDFGDYGHKWLRSWYENQDPQEYIATIPDEEMRQHHKILAGLYEKRYATDKEHLDIASVEQELIVKLGEYELVFTMDLCGLWDTKPLKTYTVIDHKFYKSIPPEEFFQYDFQASFYYWGARKAKIPVDRFYLNILRKSAPVMPAVLQRPKDGRLLSCSQSTLNNTEYDQFLQAINMVEQPPEMYAKELKFLKERGSCVFARYHVSRSAQELVNFEQKLLWILDEIHSPNNIFPDEPHVFECPRCPYKTICKVMNTGADYALTKKTLYEPKSDDER